MKPAPLALLAALLLPAPAHAQAPQDWPNLAAYRESSAALAAQPDSKRVVFMGDSITEFWDKPKQGFFADPHRVNRGISGQTTPQMLLRFRQDVLALHPRTVVILAGTNDVAGNTGPASDAQIEGNITSMVELARANHIRVILATLVPAAKYWWAPDLKPAPRIAALNAWLRAYATQNHLPLADYYPVMATPEGALKPELGDDGVHPNAAGYTVMQAVIAPLLGQ
ncbi:MAG: SGNH/GDSL hydrolase family protein [Sphingomonadales bacterium]|nr:SGNH/GDSL hydrolase family protein [Sphingomonadales bacterium]